MYDHWHYIIRISSLIHSYQNSRNAAKNQFNIIFYFLIDTDILPTFFTFDLWVSKEVLKEKETMGCLFFLPFYIIISVCLANTQQVIPIRKDMNRVPLSFMCLRVFAFILCLKKVLVQMESVASLGCHHPDLLSCRHK